MQRFAVSTQKSSSPESAPMPRSFFGQSLAVLSFSITSLSSDPEGIRNILDNM